MKRLALPLAGLLLVPLAVSAADINPYDLFLDQVKREQTIAQPDEAVQKFLKGVFAKRWVLTLDEVTGALQSKPWAACTPSDRTAPQANVIECGFALEIIKQLADEEQELRTFGHALERIASSQELPLSEIPGRPFHLATDLSGIVNIWRAGTGSVQKTVSGAMLIRTWSPKEGSAEEDALRTAIDEFVEEYSALGDEERIALINRYQYGARLVRDERRPTYPAPVQDALSGPGTERQYLFKRWEKVEDLLLNARTALPTGDRLDPPLSKNEAAYVLIPESLRTALPDNTLLWFRIGPYEAGGNDPMGDAGLAWEYPLEPFLPSLLSDESGKKDEPILGGRYPPEPTGDARGLCSMALAQRGYLCRPYAAASEELCPDDPDIDPDAITLVSCTSESGATLTVAGADACREVDWRNEGDVATRCNVQFERGPCALGDLGVTKPKEPDGTITICLDDAMPIPMTYIQEHELVHAQQLCPLPPGNVYDGLSDEESEALCCRMEGEAHLVNCKRMIEDGVLRNPDGGGPLFIHGVEVTAQTCMEMARNATCSGHQGRPVQCPSTIAFTPADSAELLNMMIGGGNPKDLPDTFAEATNPKTMDDRVAARVRTIERDIPVCAPGTESTYKNAIGNNACYIGQCVEESLELHRLTGGRSPVTTGDSAFPWDNPAMGDSLGSVLRSVPSTNPPLPSYRPQMIVRILEDALCQLQGLPAATPPHLCAFSSSRRLNLPLADGAATAQSIVLTAQEQREATQLLEQLGASLGSRIGTDIQGQYLRIGTRTLSEVVSLANTLLQDMKTVTFPTNMCPLSLGD